MNMYIDLASVNIYSYGESQNTPLSAPFGNQNRVVDNTTQLLHKIMAEHQSNMVEQIWVLSPRIAHVHLWLGDTPLS